MKSRLLSDRASSIQALHAEALQKLSRLSSRNALSPEEYQHLHTALAELSEQVRYQLLGGAEE